MATIHPDGSVTHDQQHLAHLVTELKRYVHPDKLTSEYLKLQLQVFYREGKNPMDYVLVEETIVPTHYPWEHKFVLKWINLEGKGRPFG